MSIKKIIAVSVVFLVSCIGWWILGTATAFRSGELSSRLCPQVEALWGQSLIQQAPTFASQIPGQNKVRWIMPSGNKIRVEIFTDYRKKGLIWYPTYNCTFNGQYTITNDEPVAQKIKIHFSFPDIHATYDKFAIFVDDEKLVIPVDISEGIGEIIELAPDQVRTFSIQYKTRGSRDWRYQMDKKSGRVRNFNMQIITNFQDIDYTGKSLSPMSTEQAGDKMIIKWEADDLITNSNIGVIIPEKLNPGPLTTRITFFAPVCLIFFFILITTINIMYKIDIHPMHYLFVASGFFAFHLLLSYLAGVLDINLAFIISALVSVGLVTFYLNAALAGNFPWKIAFAGQIFYLVLFSYSFFIKGITGLTIAIGSVVTLAVLMKVTADINWNDVFKKRNSNPIINSVSPEEMVPPPIPGN